MRVVPTLPLFPVQPADRALERRKKTALRPARAPGPPQSAPLSRTRPSQLWLAIHCDARKEGENLAHLAAWCQQQFTPLVSVESTDELLLEVRGSLRLFGGARALLERIAAGLNERGVTARLALTPTPRSALWLARGSGRSSRKRSEGASIIALIARPEALAQRLAPVSLHHLRWPEELLAQLLGMGLRTVGDLLRLPRGGGVRRFGRAWLDELDCALGRRADVRRGFRRPERFDERRVLEHQIEAAAGLEHACEPLWARLQEFLQQRQATVAVLAVELTHRTHSLTRLRIGLAAPSGDVDHLRGLLAERLAALSLPAPVIAIRMRSGALLDEVQATHHFRNFTPQPLPGTDALPRLIERLQARLGNDAVFGVSSAEDHRPERAWRVIDIGSPGEKAESKGKEWGRRPLWLLAEPRTLPFSLPCATFRLLRGPERIETGWWDGREVTRDYFVARDGQGVRWWLYRDRRGSRGWHVHGRFG